MAVGALSGRVAIITGGGRGIGAACAEVFVREGAKVAIASRSEDELREVVSNLGSNVISVPTDVADEAAVIRLFVRVVEKWGKLDILVNNAGCFHAESFANLSSTDWDRVMNVNLRGSFLCAREAFRRMKKGGAIVNISSLAGIRSTQKFKGFVAYSAAKAGLVGLTEALAAEGEDLGIRVNCVAPGAIETQMLKQALPHLKAEAKPADLAEIILGLCDEKRSHILTGAVVEVRTRVSV